VDGPGQRLVYYLKGCNMRCLWCANPEGLEFCPEMLFYPDRSPNSIDHVCPYGALERKLLDRDKCKTCTTRECIEKWRCPCLELAGFELSPEDILDQATKAGDMFGPDGGITFGGGEATLQSEPLLETIKLLKNAGIHTAVESNGATDSFRDIAECVDLVICDLKAYSDDLHIKMTGISNSMVLKNLKYIVGNKQNVWVRIPLVSGLNDSPEEMTAMAAFIHEIASGREALLPVEILRMHHLGRPKYDALGTPYPALNLPEPEPEKVRKFIKILQHDKITVSTGG